MTIRKKERTSQVEPVDIERVMAIAGQLFAEQGYDGVGVRLIAKECGVSMPTIFYYFGSKSSLYEEVLEYKYKAIAEMILCAIQAIDDPMKRLECMMGAFYDLLLKDRTLLLLLHRDIVDVIAHKQRSAFMDEYSRAYSLFCTLLEAALGRQVERRVAFPLVTEGYQPVKEKKMEDNKWIEKRNLQFLYWSAMCGFICFAGYLIFWAGIAHMVPVPPQAWSPEELANNFLIPYQTDIMIGMMGSGFFGMLWLPHAAALFALMMRGEYKAEVLGLTQFFAGGITAWVMASSPMGWAIAAKYASTDPLLAHMHWLKEWYIYDCTYMITALQVVPTGIYILCDKTKYPIFPRWLGWFSIYVGLSYVPLSLMPFNETGPFSYDGLWNFWGLYIGGYLFYPISTVYMLRYIKREMRKLDETSRAQLQIA